MTITLGWSCLPAVAGAYARSWKVEMDNMRAGVSIATENTTGFKKQHG